MGGRRCWLRQLMVVIDGRDSWMTNVPVLQYFGLIGGICRCDLKC